MADTTNPFDDPKFDGSNANPFDDPSFDGSSGLIRRTAGDALTGVAQGLVALPQTAMALANVATGGLAERAGSAIRAAADTAVNAVGDKITGNHIGRDYGVTGDTLTQGMNNTTNDIGQLYSPEVQQAQQNAHASVDEYGKKAQDVFGPGAISKLAGEAAGGVVGMVKNPSSIMPVVAQSLPSMLVPSAIVGRVASGVFTRAVETAITSGASKEAATAIGHAAVQKFTESAPGIATAALSEGIMGGGQNAQQAKAAVLDMPQDKLASLQAYKDLIKSGVSPQEARLQMADTVEAHAMIAASALSSAAGPIAGRLEARAGARMFGGEAGKGVRVMEGGKNLAQNIGAQAAQETLQSAGEQIGQNIGTRAIDPSQDLLEGVGEQGGMGLLTGGVFGAGEHFMANHGGHPTVNVDGTVNTASGHAIDPNAGPISAAAASAVVRGLDAPLPYHDDASAALAVQLATIQANHDANESVKRQSPDYNTNENKVAYDATGAQSTLAAAKDEAARPKTITEVAHAAVQGGTVDAAEAEKMGGTVAPLSSASTNTEGKTNEAESTAGRGQANDAAEGALPEGTARNEGTGTGELAGDSERVSADGVGGGQADEGKALPEKVTPVDEAAHEAATSTTNDKAPPTPDQIKAGNYEKGHLRLHGLDISVENPQGSTRSGVGEDGKPWTSDIHSHYGYIRGTVGADKDHIDAFVKPGTTPEHDGPVFVIDQKHQGTGAFDEHKVMLGFKSKALALIAYRKNYPSSHSSGPITETTAERFKAWAKNGDTTKPFAEGTKPDAAPGPVKPSIPPAPSRTAQFDSYAKAIAEGKSSPGMLEQVRADERLNDGEAEDLAKLSADHIVDANKMIERRTDAAARKRVSDMTSEEKAKALLTDDLTSLGNRRAYNESDKQAAQTSIDVDSLKWVNDNLNHESGDNMLRLVGEAIARETAHGFHISGDEFVIQSATPAEAAAIMARVNETLAGATLEYTAPDGTVTTIKGIGVSHGTAESLTEADARLQQHKSAREVSGERAGRGEVPPSATRETAEGRDAARQAAAEEERVAADKARTEAEAAAKSLAEAATKAESDKMTAARKAVRQSYRQAQADAHAAIAALDLTGEKNIAALVKQWITEQLTSADARRKASLEVLAETPDDLAKIVASLTKIANKQTLAAAKAAKEAEKKTPPPAKLQNTGIDLRRHWESFKANLKSKNDADGITSMNAIFAATTRADFFADLLDKDATPGLQKYASLVRDQVKPFKAWITSDGPLRHVYGRRYKDTDAEKIASFVRGEAHPEKSDAWKEIFGDKWDELTPKDATLAQRLQFLQDAADTYVDTVSRLIAPLAGKSGLADGTKAFGEFAWTSEKSADGKSVRYSTAPGLTKLSLTRIVDGWSMRDLRADGYKVQRLLANETTIEAKSTKDKLIAPRLDRVTRTGLDDAREGRDVTPQEFKDTFGFADIGFGSWVKSKEDQGHMNAAFDAFHDLATFVGIDPKMIGFNGKLHFTLGALGQGKKAAATFHPGHPTEGGLVQVINLTKTKGDGTVAHEWFHALDHFMQRTPENAAHWKEFLAGLKFRRDASALEERVLAALKGQTWMRGNKRADAIENARDILSYHARQSQDTEYFKNAKALDGGKVSDPYWSNNAEIPARAWEAYIGDHLGGTNNYLVNTAWVGDGILTAPRYRGTPYPRGTERAEFAAWFKALLGSVDMNGGLPTMSTEKWNALKPFNEKAWAETVREIHESIPERFEALQREKAAEQAEKDRLSQAAFAAASATKAAAAKAAAEAQAREDEASNPAPSQEPTGDLTASDLDSLFDSAAEDLRAESGTNATKPEPGERALNHETPPTKEISATLIGDTHKMDEPASPKASALIAEAAKQGVKGIDEALKALTSLFGGGKIQSFPGGFDEDSYAKAKPHFEQALKAFQAAGRSLKDLFKLLIQQFGEGVKPYAIRFAQDAKLTAELSSKTETSGASKVADWVKAKLDDGMKFSSMELFAKANEAYGGTQGDGTYTPKDAYDALELGMNRYILSQPRFGSSSADHYPVSEARANILELHRVAQLLATQTKRTQEQDEFQQFSTVPALAYAANWVANIKAGETMLEPSAGIGGLAVFATHDGANVVANELSDRRAALLREALPDARVFTENAEHINDVLPDDVKPSVIVMNPPFSSTAGRVPGQRDTKNGAMHIEQALARLADGGRLVAIVGNGMDASKPAFSAWWAGIKTKYNVLANLNLNGSEYSKYGTSFDNNLLVIDKTGPTTKDVVTGRVEKYSDLPALLSEIREARHEPLAGNSSPEQGQSEQSGGGTIAADGVAQPGVADGGGAGTVGDRSGRIGDDAGRGDAGRGDGTDRGLSGSGGSDAGNGAGGKKSGRGSRAGSGRGKQPDAGSDGRAGIDTGADGKQLTGVALDTEQQGKRDTALSDSIFENYEPQKAKLAGSKPHPGQLVESAAMAAVESVDVTYTPNLPVATIAEGKLSSAQIEPIIYAGQAHQELLPNGERRGYFIGDGTGVGKGREIAGIILDNQRQGRKKHLWISAKSGLFKDAKRDIKGIGANDEGLFKLSDTSPKDKVTGNSGTMFLSYDILRSGEKKNPNEKDAKVRSRVDQIVEWAGEDFDGVIAFDEAHKMGNLGGGEKGPRGAKEASKMAQAGVDLQKRLPKARIVYVSATGATEVSNLMFANRLGLWGENTAFATPAAFSASISAAGLASMELVARDMKAQGSYIARSLSYEGVGYERLESPLSPLQTEIYDELASAWQIVLQNIDKALETTGQKDDPKAKGAALSRFWGTHQRFFNQVITSMQTPAIIDRAQREITNGNAVVFQLVNTNEATQERLAKSAEADGEPIEELDFSPRQILIEFIKNGFPVQKFEMRTDPATGKPVSVGVTNAAGDPVFDKAAIAARDALVEKLQDIRVPDNPIDLIINALGHDSVAEVTGRGRRFVQEHDGEGGFKLLEQKRGGKSSENDANAFQDDKKKALIFSDAGGTGYSFQSDREAKNQRQRIHFLVQPGWRADNAVQGFGRTHRSNEVNQPTYILPTTNLKAQRRFISSIARRLDQLGALTKGQRNTGSQGLFANKDNLESKYAVAALRSLIEDMAPSNRVVTGALSNSRELIKAMGLDGIYDDKTGNVIETKMPPITRFLNRLLSLKTTQQDALFGEFEQRMDAAMDAALKAGTYDDGMQTVRALNVSKIRDETIFTDPRTQATTHYVELNLTNEARLNDWDTAQQEIEDHPGKGLAYYRDTKKNTVFAVIDLGDRVGGDGQMQARGYRVGISAGQSTYSRGTYITNRSSMEAKPIARRTKEDGAIYSAIPYQKLTPEAAKSLWAIEYDRAPKTVDSQLHMLTGVLLPVWDRIQTKDGSSAVVRTQTDAGERFIGRVLPYKDRAEVLKNFGIGAIRGDMTAREIIDRLYVGDTAKLSNGWMIARVRLSGESRLEIKASYLSGSEQRILQNQGAIIERIQYRERVFIPNGGGQEAVFEAITRGANRPVIDLQKKSDAEDGESHAVAQPTKSDAGDRFSPKPDPLNIALRYMAHEGTTARPILARIAKEGTTPFNRVLAQALLDAGVNSTVRFGEAYQLSLQHGAAIAAASYHGKSDTVTLMNGANVEKHMLHEFAHAATVAAIDRNTLAAIQLRALMQKVRESGLVDAKLYGMTDEFEFIAEAMSNPKFQDALRGVPIEGRGSIATAWHAFVDLVRRILKLADGNALSEALAIGAHLMEDTKDIRNSERFAERRAGYDRYADESGRLFNDVTLNSVRQNVTDRLTSQRSFNWWNRTVGTQYQKAMQNEQFKRVFDIGQRYLQDTSQFAMNAADLAPTILPKLGSVADVGRSVKSAFGREGKRNMEAVSKAIFQGTLTDSKTYTDDELHSEFGLNDKQVALYHEFRNAADRMLDELMSSDAARLARGKGIDDAIAAAKANPQRGASIIANALRETGDTSTAKMIDDKAGRVAQLQREGYAPLARFGQHTVYVVGPKGEQEYFGMYEGEAEANRAARALQESHPDSVVTQGIMSKDAWQMFQGISPDTLELFADSLGVGENEVFQEYLKKTINNRSALKRMIERKGVAGFSEDAPRALASFITSSARMAAKNYNMGAMTQAVEDIPKERGDVKDEAVRLAKYLQNPQEEAPMVRGLLFTNYIGGSIASALTNMTQPVLQTFPYLAQWGTARAGSELTKAAKIASVGGGDADLNEALKRAEADGVIAPHELHQLYSESIRGFGSNPLLRSAAKVWGSFFSLAESFNRRLTFVAAYNIGKTLDEAALAKAGVADAFEFAEKAIHETQGIYNRGNRPNWARGAIGATVFTFKQFSVSYLEFLTRLPPKEKAIALAILVLAAGTQGLPFAEDIEDIIDTLGQSMGYDTNSKQAFRLKVIQAATALGLGAGVGKFITQGLSSVPGVPIDVQGRLGLSNLVPGTAMFKRSNPDKGKEALEVIGPLGAFVNSVTQALTRAQSGDWQGVARMGLPVAVQNALKAVDMVQTGAYRDSKGRTVAKTTIGDAIAKGIGFQPADVGEQSNRVNDAYQNIELNQVVRGQIAERWARGIFEQDAAKVRDATDALREWNRKNPTNIIRITPATIHERVKAMSLTQDIRLVKSAPKAVRGDVLATVQ